MSNTVVISGTITALSPIHHGGDEKTGSTPVLRSITMWDPLERRHVRMPFLCGNAIRGLLRRHLFRDFLEKTGYQVESPKLHHALYTGGVLESTDESTGTADLAFRKMLRDILPPVELFGTAVANQMVPGCLKVDHAFPVCRERLAYLDEASASDPRALQSVRTFTDVTFATRRDDLRAQREEDEQAHQMLLEFECFVPGTLFLHSFILSYPSPLASAALARALDLWRQEPYIGGKSSSGYGKIEIAYSGPLDAGPYLNYLETRKAEIVEVLDALAEKLG